MPRQGYLSSFHVLGPRHHCPARHNYSSVGPHPRQHATGSIELETIGIYEDEMLTSCPAGLQSESKCVAECVSISTISTLIPSSRDRPETRIYSALQIRNLQTILSYRNRSANFIGLETKSSGSDHSGENHNIVEFRQDSLETEGVDEISGP